MYLDGIVTGDGYKIECMFYTQLSGGATITHDHYTEITISGKGLYFEITLGGDKSRDEVRHTRDNMIKMHNSGLCWMYIKEYYEL